MENVRLLSAKCEWGQHPMTCLWVQEGSKPPGAENAEEVRILNGSGVSIEPCWTTEGGETVEGCRVYIQVRALL